jgi:cytochrome c-type biogenesis protein CcmH
MAAMAAPFLFLFAPAALAAGAAAWWILRAYAQGAPKRPATLKALLAAGAAGTAALALYLALGRPDLPDAPFGRRLAELTHRDPAKMSPQELLAVLGARARADPNDPRPHLYTGQILSALGRDDEAARAFDAALRRDPNSPEALLGLGRALVQREQGVVTPTAIELFRRAAEASPNDPTPWLYQALAANQQGDAVESLRLWREVSKRLAPNDPRHAMVAAMIAEAEAKVTQKTR